MSPANTSKVFTVRCADTDNETGSSSRAIRRVIVNAEVLKIAKISAGDPIAMVNAAELSESNKVKHTFE